MLRSAILAILASTILPVLCQGAPDAMARAKAAKEAWQADTGQAFGFEVDGLWSDGETVTEPRKSGAAALRWAKHTEAAGISCLKMPKDLSAFNSMSFWLHSSHANDATFMIIMESKHDPKINSYYSKKVQVNWTGWKKVEFRLRSFGKARQPAGWGKIGQMRFTASGWNQRPEDESIWVLDDLQFTYDPKPYRPKIDVKKYVAGPVREDFLAKLRPEHPRLVLLDKDLPRIKRFIAEDPKGKVWYAAIQSKAGQLYRRPPRKHELPDGRRLLSISRDEVSRMYYWGFMYRLEGDRKWLDRAWQEVQAVVAFKDWNPSHYLDTAEMMHAMAIGYDWFYHGFTEEQRKVLRDGIWQHGLRLSYAAYMGLEAEGQQHWYRVTNNWNFVCNGGSAMAAMALLDELPEECTEVLYNAYQFIQIPMHHFEPDGAWWEGIGYWGYSMRYLLTHLRGMETAFGTDFGMVEGLKGKGFSMSGDFPIYLTTPLGGIFNFADSGSGGGSYRHWAFYYLAARYQNPLYLHFQDQRARGTVDDLIYYEPFESDLAIQDVPLDKYFRATEVVTARSSWTDPNALFLGVKSGKNGIAHAHQDLGSFIFYGLGEKWVQDMGTEGQTYQSHKHHLSHSQFYRIREEGHNTLVFDPGKGYSQDRKGESKITRFETSPGDVFAIADLTDPYRKYVTSAKRGYRLFDQRRVLLVQDEIQTKKETELWWFAHGTTGTVMTLKEGGREAIMERNGKLCHAYLLSPAGATFEIMNARPLPTSPDPEIQQQNKNVKKLAVHLPKTQNVTISVLMVPRFAFDPESKPLIHLAPLDSWKLAVDTAPRLDKLMVNGTPLSGFSPNVFTYSVQLPPETTGVPTMAAMTTGAKVSVQQATTFPGTTSVTVTGKAKASTVYQVRFVPTVIPGSTQKPHVKSKPVTVRGLTLSASHDDGNIPKNVLDGNPETRWSASGEKEWIGFDFGKPRRIEAVRMAWYSGANRSTSFQIETSADGKTWQLARKANSSGKTADLETYALGKTQSTRYLRVVCFGNTSNLWNSITELDFIPPLGK